MISLKFPTVLAFPSSRKIGRYKKNLMNEIKSLKQHAFLSTERQVVKFFEENFLMLFCAVHYFEIFYFNNSLFQNTLSLPLKIVKTKQ